MSVAGTRVLFIVKRLLMSERCHRAGRSKHGSYLSIGGGLEGALVGRGRAETTPADTFHLPPPLPNVHFHPHHRGFDSQHTTH